MRKLRVNVFIPSWKSCKVHSFTSSSFFETWNCFTFQLLNFNCRQLNKSCCWHVVAFPAFQTLYFFPPLFHARWKFFHCFNFACELSTNVHELATHRIFQLSSYPFLTHAYLIIFSITVIYRKKLKTHFTFLLRSHFLKISSSHRFSHSTHGLCFSFLNKHFFAFHLFKQKIFERKKWRLS